MLQLSNSSNYNTQGCCPYCQPKSWPNSDPFLQGQCVLNKPLMMVIPPEGVHLSCPIHPEGHHIFGTYTYC